MAGAYKTVPACSCFAGVLLVLSENWFACVTQCHLLLISRKSWLVCCCCRPTLLFRFDLLHPAGRGCKGKLAVYFFKRWQTRHWELKFCGSSFQTGSLLTRHCLMSLTVSLASPQISSPSPVWLLSASSLWLQTAQHPLESEEKTTIWIVVSWKGTNDMEKAGAVKLLDS